MKVKFETTPYRRYLTCQRSRLYRCVWIIPILFFLGRIIGNANDYNQFLSAKKEFEESSIYLSSLWMPVIHSSSNSSTKIDNRVVTHAVKSNFNKIISTDNATNIRFLPSTTINYSDQSIYWRYDEAAPPIRYARTHQLKSLPLEYRIDSSALRNLTEYVVQPKNQYPQKLHVFENNPSITILPQKYQITFDGSNGTIPRYLASYKLTHKHACFGYKKLMYGGGDWNSVKKIPKTNYLGLALLSVDLTILGDVVVRMDQKGIERAYTYSDYRLYTIHNDLYLSTGINIGRLELGLPGTTTSREVQEGENLIQLSHLDKDNRFSVHLHPKPSCPVSYSHRDTSSKNLLYFVDDDNNTMVEYWPTGNPNQVRDIDLTIRCDQGNNNQPGPQNNNSYIKRTGANVTFRNFHEKRFRNSKVDMFLGDRGSACCIRMKNPWTEQEYFIGIVHPKTPFPGKMLPKGVKANIYLSRFFAMQTTKPYAIDTRTGSFCFGYPHPTEVENTVLWNEQNAPLTMAEEMFRCPRIHFVMSMIDNVANNSQAIISYGVSDCTSRFIIVDKAGIQSMLWPERQQ